MVEKLGIFEVNEEEGFVRVKHAENEYEYLVSVDKYGLNARAAVNLFSKAYHYGLYEKQAEFKKVIGLL